MQIREIHIEGFGIFHDKQVTGLNAGLNVIYGENEAGKTTLIEFIRRILFEIPRKSKGFNSYPPLNGGRHGGSLKCLLASNEGVLVTRTLSDKNAVDISPSIGGLKGQPALDSILSHASENIFKNIFAFTLDELQSFDSLEGDEIKNRIYGAELGLGEVSLKQVEKTLNDPADEIFLPRGKKTKTNLLLNEIKAIEKEIRTIQNQSEEYDRLTQLLESSLKAQRPRQVQIESLEAQKRNLETRRDLYQTVREMRAIESELHDLGTVVEFPETGLQVLDGLTSEKKNLLARLDKEESEVNKMRIEQGSLPVNHDLLSHTTDIMHLQQSVQSIKISLTDTGKLQQETSVLAREIQANLQEIGGTWNEEKVLNFAEFNRAKMAQIETFLKDFENLRLDRTKAQDRLENHREQKARERSKGWNLPAWLKIVAYGLTALGLAGLAWSWVDQNIPLGITAVVITIFGGIFFWKILKEKKYFVPDDHLEKSLIEKLSQTQSAEDQKKSAWRAWLKAMAFDESLEPLSAQEFGSALKEIKGKFLEKAELERRIADMRNSLADTAKRIDKIKFSLPENSLPGPIPVDIEIINGLFAQTKDNLTRKSQNEKQVQKRVFEIDKLKNQLKEVESSLGQIIQKAGVTDQEDFRAKNKMFATRNSLQEKATQKRNVIEMRTGSGPHYQQFVREVESQSPDEILSALAQVSRELKGLQGIKDEAHESIGETRNQLEQLASNDEMLVKQGEREIKKQKLQDHVKKWATAKLALVMLELAKKQYEKTRQPGVLKSAESVFSEITGGKYPKIVKPLDEDEVFIQNEKGVQNKVSQTSRGTREQLYLSMRLGLIEEYERRSESLPLIMDDVLVNFDDSRKAKVIATLKRFSRDRQIIVLTCHQASLEAYMEAGATQIEI
jgi:uncharacterized protein YhaN